MEKLKATLDKLIVRLQNSDELLERLETLISVYPFNEFEYIISTLMGANLLSLDDYYELRDEYIARNMYLCIFSIFRGELTSFPNDACVKRGTDETCQLFSASY